ncbi:hypothetical protein ABH922_003737 [Rhodococcus sp. 27YEA15]|uniref:hypothetical protein n=1 Tax=Rhodococcus sp. 27YEA15 TaxID=3156259 RepID=UPI003C7B3EAD
MSGLTITTDHLRRLLASSPRSELVAIGGEIEIFVPDEEGFQLDGVSLIGREQLAERVIVGSAAPDEAALSVAAQALTSMIAELGG